MKSISAFCLAAAFSVSALWPDAGLAQEENPARNLGKFVGYAELCSQFRGTPVDWKVIAEIKKHFRSNYEFNEGYGQLAMYKGYDAMGGLDDCPDFPEHIRKLGNRYLSLSSPQTSTTTQSGQAKETPRSKNYERPVAVSWDGVAELISGTVSVEEDASGGRISMAFPDGKSTCTGNYRSAGQGNGTWSVACTNGLAASGFMRFLGTGKGSSGTGKDAKGRAVRFTVGGN